MKRTWVAAVTFACVVTFPLMASERGGVYILGSHESQVIYKNRIGNAWGSLFFLPKGGKEFSLYANANLISLLFEESNSEDFSRDKNYLMVHKIEHATLSSGDGQDESVERYYCSFIDMRSGCIVRENTGEFCGGAWGEMDGEWISGGNSNHIDERQNLSRSQNDRRNYFDTFADDDNFRRCLPR